MRCGQPEKAAATALFLAWHGSACFTRQWLSPNGGLFTGSERPGAATRRAAIASLRDFSATACAKILLDCGAQLS